MSGVPTVSPTSSCPRRPSSAAGRRRSAWRSSPRSTRSCCWRRLASGDDDLPAVDRRRPHPAARARGPGHADGMGVLRHPGPADAGVRVLRAHGGRTPLWIIIVVPPRRSSSASSRGRRPVRRSPWRACSPARSPSRSRSSTARSAASSASARAWSTSRSRVSCSPAPSLPPSSRRSPARRCSACSPPCSPACSSRRARRVRDQVPRRPGHRRRRAQRARHGPDELPLLAGAACPTPRP